MERAGRSANRYPDERRSAAGSGRAGGLGDAGDDVPLDAARDYSAGARCVDSLDLIG